MILTRCSSVESSFRLIERRPFVRQYSNCYLSNWTLYDENGYIISDTTYRRGTRELAAYKGDQTPADRYVDVHQMNNVLRASDKKRIWIGPMHGQFGHFLLNIFARAWPVIERAPEEYIFCYCCAPPPEVLFQVGFMRDIFEGVGIQINNLELITEATVIEDMLVAEPAFIENWSVNAILPEFANSISRRLGIDIDTISEAQEPVYVSKQNVKSGVRSICNENEIVNYLKNKNIKIAYPDSMSFRDQIIFWNSYKNYFGFSSSAFHMSAFTTRKRFSTLSWSDKAESNQVLIDAATGNDHLYLYGGDHIRSRGPSENFSDVIEILDPERVAENFLRLIVDDADRKFGQSICPIRAHDRLRNNYLMPFGYRLDAGCVMEGPELRASSLFRTERRSEHDPAYLIGNQSRTEESWQAKIRFDNLCHLYQIRLFKVGAGEGWNIDHLRMVIDVSEDGETWMRIASNAIVYHRILQEHILNLSLSRPYRFIRMNFPAQGQTGWGGLQVYGQPVAVTRG